MQEDYLKARKLGEKEYRRALQKGHYPYLPALDYMLGNEILQRESRVGVMEIPVSMIAGTRTQGRQNAFASNFMPLLAENTEFGMKWSNLYEAQMKEGFRDAIKAYEYMRRFYVLEGNKRVSVAKYLNLASISAEVIRLLPPKTQEKDSLLYYEFLDFFRCYPTYDIGFSEPGSYRKLAEVLGLTLEEVWPEDAVINLRSAYNTFSKQYQELGGGKLSITTGDAFLLYVTVYRLESLLSCKQTEIRSRITRLWKEFVAETGELPVSLVEKPEDGDKSGGLVSSLAGNITQSLPGGMKNILKITPVFTEKKPLRVHFLYDRFPEDSSWIYGHELGRQELEQSYPGIVRTSFSVVPSGDEAFEETVRDVAAGGADMVFTTSPIQMEKTLRAAVEYPKIHFLNCSINLSRSAVRTYYARMYEAKFLMGALAASMADNHRIGYMADYPIYAAIANINAFAIGAAMIDPAAKVVLEWSTKRDTNWQEAFMVKGIRVISGPDMNTPSETASRVYGIYRMDEDGKVMNLAMPVWNWGKYYELIVQTVLDGTWEAKSLAKKDQPLNYWYGMSSGVIDVILSNKLPYSSRKLVDLLKNALIAETLNPFDGELHSQDGMIKDADAPRLSHEEIINMDWLNDNVEGEIPEYEALTQTARETVSVSGVKGKAGLS